MRSVTKRKTASELFKGRVKALRALGYELGKGGRVRKGGRPVRVSEVEQAAAKIDRSKKRQLAKSKLIPGLERTTPAKKLEDFTIADAAKWTGKSPRTIRKWIREGGTPPEALDTIRAKLSGERPYAPTWVHGQRPSWTVEERKKLQRALRMFVHGKRRRAGDLAKRYDNWYAEKTKLRDKLTKKAWKDLMKKIGKAEHLADEGSFSIMRFTLS